MKKLVFVSCLLALAACDSSSSVAKKDCASLGYKPGTTEYEHCKVDMKQAEKMNSQNKAAMK